MVPLALLHSFLACVFVVNAQIRDTKSNFEVADSYRDSLLGNISALTQNVAGVRCAGNGIHYEMVKVPVELHLFPTLTGKIDLVSQILGDDFRKKTTNELEKNDLVKSVLCKTLFSSPRAEVVRISYTDGESNKVIFQDKSGGSSAFNSSASARSTPPHQRDCNLKLKTSGVENEPWYRPLQEKIWNTNRFQSPSTTNVNNQDKSGSLGGIWTYPYYHCQTGRWLTTYAKLVTVSEQSRSAFQPPAVEPKSVISVDVDLSYLDINQCDSSNRTNEEGVIKYFRNTHKCDTKSTNCVFVPGNGWKKGGYVCKCKYGYYNKWNSTFPGTNVEAAYENKQTGVGNHNYDRFVCLPCAEGCNTCLNDPECQAYYNMPFRIVLLTISMLCIVLTLIVMGIVYHNRSIKVFKVASPAFLEICLFGCIIMYSEMATIFPVLDVYWCIATKWARHMGFCITFSSLLMKTWRVSLTYRVKSAHKIKLTDKQLLQWMTPILLIMSIYLGAWTISDPPKGENITDGYGLSFKQCNYNWWDHALAIGEMSFLLWGVKVCYGVRKAESFFDEAKCISWAVYNITVVNVIMACFHIFIFPKAGPDLKYFFGFIRTQLSTTTTIGLVFGPKLVRVLKGTGDQLDNRARAKGVTASFSINGIGGSGDEPPDPLEENEELKEEIQKLAAQIEFMKIVNMEMNNRHLRPKPGGYFSADKNCVLSTSGQSPTVHKNSLCRMEINENSSSASLNPTSEGAGDKV